MWLPTGDYAFARLALIPTLNSTLYLHSGTDQVLFAGGWLPKWRPSAEETLVLYGVVVANPGAWTPNNNLTYLYEIATGVETAAKGLANYVNNRLPSQTTPAHAAFRELMLGDNDTRRVVYVRDGSSQVCATDPASTPLPLQINITCGTQNAFTQFTGVHELGHVLVRVTYADFNTLVNAPDPATPARTALWNSGGFVFGIRGLFFFPEDLPPGVNPEYQQGPLINSDGDTYYTLTDFQRGTRGWGSGIASTGPCGNVPPGQPVPLPTDFQQNPCQVADYLMIVTNDERTTELEETAADKYLNWVYRWHAQTVTTAPSGFLEFDWETPQCAAGCADSSNPGTSRFEWMNCALDVIWNKYQWFNTTVSLSGGCAAYGMSL